MPTPTRLQPHLSYWCARRTWKVIWRAISRVLFSWLTAHIDAKLTFRSISSIHVYSLQPAALQDLNILTDVSRETLATYAHEDPLEYGKQWGMIQNQNVKVYCNHSMGFAPYMEPNADIHYSGEQEHDRRRQRHQLKHLPT